MMKKLLFIFVCLLTFGGFSFISNTAEAASLFPFDKETEQNEKEAKGIFGTLFDAIKESQALNEELSNKKVSLKFEKEFTFPSLIKIDEIKEEITEKNEKTEELKEELEELREKEAEEPAESEEEKNEKTLEQEILENKIIEQQEEVKTLSAKFPGLRVEYEERKEKQAENIVTFEEEIIRLEEDMERQRALMRNQIYRFASNILFFLGIIVLILVIRYVVSIIIQKFFKQVNAKRKKTLLHLNKIVFNVIIAFVLLGAIFSQMINMLPVIAIIGTGLAFAVRDTISSFIGYFVIGTSRGYKIGHLIKVGDVFGKVQEIGPILTIIQDLTHLEKTGKTISFPNKFIFEKEIENLSKNFNFLQRSVQFLLKEGSDIGIAKALLLKIIKVVNKENEEKIDDSLKKFERNLSVSVDDIKPKVWTEWTKQGVSIRGSFFAEFVTIKLVKDEIIKNFTEEISKEKKVSIRILDY